MTEQDLILDGVNTALAVLDFAFPAAGPVISIAKTAIPALVAAAPDIKRAIDDGLSALEAAEAASPGLKGQIGSLLTHAGGAPAATPAHMEKMVRTALSLPHMTPEQEARWMQNATPLTDQDSRFGGG